MRTPQDSEGVTTVQINTKSLKENTFSCYHWIAICAEHWLSHSLAVILIRGNIAGVNWLIYNDRWKRRRFTTQVWWFTSFRIPKYTLRNPQPKANARNSFRLPEFPKKIEIHVVALFSVGCIFVFIRQLKTEDRSCTEYNQHTRSTAKLPTDATKSSHKMHLFCQTEVKWRRE